MTRSRPQLRPGFTLIELVTVIALMGILTASAIPAISTLRSTRAGAAAAEVRRLLQYTRSAAVATGRPTGLKVQAGSVLTPVQIRTVGAAVTTLIGPLGEAEPAVPLTERFSGPTIARAALGTGEAGAVTFWFRFDGTPQTRLASGALGAAWSTDGRIEISNGPAIVVRRVSGAIE